MSYRTVLFRVALGGLSVVLAVALLVWIGRGGTSPSQPPTAQDGVLDLRDWDFRSDGAVDLHGEWRFFPDRFVKPGEDIRADQTIEVPGYWNRYSEASWWRAGSGFATYALTVLLPETPGPLAINAGSVQTAYTLYAGGQRVASAGSSGVDRVSTTPAYRVNVEPLAIGPENSELQVTLHVSNFHHRLGGIWEEARLGAQTQMETAQSRAIQAEVFLSAVILTVGMYHLVFFLLRHRERASLWFSLFCFAVVLRTLVTGQMRASVLFPGLPWGVLLKVEYLSFYVSLPIFLLYFASVFPDELSSRVMRPFYLLAAAFSAVVLATPARIYTWTVQPFQVMTVVCGIVVLAGVVRAILHHRDGAIILCSASIVFFSAVVNDVLHANQLVDTLFLVPAGFLLFVLSQAFLLTRRLTRTFHVVELQSQQLSDAVEELHHTNRQLELSRSGLVVGMAKLAESRDNDTGAHLERIREYCRILAIHLCKLTAYETYITPQYIEDLCQSAILHDIGKVGVPDAILLKPSRLTAEEFAVIKRHPVLGGETIASVEGTVGSQSFLTMAREIAYAHHEKWDGTGYPRGISGEAIPLSARVVALADVYDALTSVRPYKPAFSHEDARRIILESRGTHFDSDVVDAFLVMESDFRAIGEHILEPPGLENFEEMTE